MKKKTLLVTLLTVSMLAVLTACGSKGNESAAKEDTKTTAKADDTTADAAKTYDNLTVDTEAKTVTFDATVNGLYFTEPTRHAIVTKGGGNAEKSMFVTDASNVDINDALADMGVKGDSNVTMDDMKATVDKNIVNTGDALEYSIKWDGQEEMPFKDIIKADKDFDWNVVFTGNRDAAVSTKAGCVLCLDSCAAGVSVNTLPVGTTAEGGTAFTADGDKLPADGSTVTITIKVAE